MTGYDTWDDERDRLLHAVGPEQEERIGGLLDRAADAAQDGRLADAAAPLEEARRAMVEGRLFQAWDEGIWCLSSLLGIVRRLSDEATVPPAYQRLLDAVPSARLDDEMTPAQKAFWYGSPTAVVGGELRIGPPAPAAPTPGGKGCLLLIAGIGTIVLAARSLLA